MAETGRQIQTESPDVLIMCIIKFSSCLPSFCDGGTPGSGHPIPFYVFANTAWISLWNICCGNILLAHLLCSKHGMGDCDF